MQEHTWIHTPKESKQPNKRAQPKPEGIKGSFFLVPPHLDNTDLNHQVWNAKTLELIYFINDPDCQSQQDSKKKQSRKLQKREQKEKNKGSEQSHGYRSKIHISTSIHPYISSCIRIAMPLWSYNHVSSHSWYTDTCEHNSTAHPADNKQIQNHTENEQTQSAKSAFSPPRGPFTSETRQPLVIKADL